MKPIAILGAGPAGMLAAYACSINSRPFALISHPVKSVLGGAQFLHVRIPELTDMFVERALTYRVDGDPAVYQQKVYGDNPHVDFVSMSFVKDGQTVRAWSLRDVYDVLWDQFSDGINAHDVGPKWLEDEAEKFEFIISAIPRDRLCKPWSNHNFPFNRVQIANQAMNPNIPDNEIWYDGTFDRSWYRMSQIFGVGSTEWGPNIKPPGVQLVSVRKPLKTNCDCWGDLDIVRVGRYGRWEKGVLAHDGYERVAERFALQ